MSNLRDESKAEEVSKYFRDVIHDAGNAKNCWSATIILRRRSTTGLIIDITSYTHYMKILAQLFQTAYEDIHVVNQIIIVASLTCKCQKRNANMRPMPKPIHHATKRKAIHRRFLNSLKTTNHSGISFIVWAKILV